MIQEGKKKKAHRYREQTGCQSRGRGAAGAGVRGSPRAVKRYKLPESALSRTICKLMQQLWETVWRLLKKLKIELPSDSAISLFGYLLKKTKITS